MKRISHLSLFRRLSQFSIRRQLFILYLPVVFLSTVTIGLLLVYDSTKQLTGNYQHLAELNAQRVKSVLFDTTNTLTNTASSLSNDTHLRQLLTANYLDDQEAIVDINSYDQLDEIRNLQTSIAKLTIYTTNQTIPNYKYFQQADDTIQATAWYQRALKQPDAFLMTMLEDYKADRLSLYKTLPLPLSKETAVLEIQVDYNYLSNRLRNSSYELELQLNDDVIFYSDKINQVGEPGQLTALSEPQTSAAFLKNDGTKVMLTKSTLPMSNKEDIITIYSADTNAYSNLRANLIRWSTIVLVILITTFIIVFLFARFFTKRISQLQQAVYFASIEDYDFFQNISGEDEISQISLDFHKIIQRIKKKEEEIYRSRLAQQELLTQQQQMEFNILAGQINPHFLFNTLETIRMMALTSGNSDVVYAIKLLAKSMRYTLEAHGTKRTSLEESLDAVHVYVKIQRMRFGDRVNFSYSVSNEIDQKEVQILPLLIQPLVENAISHGLEGITYPGFVRLTITKDGHDLVIVVQDNGSGIPPEKLELLQQKIKTPSTHAKKNIGLANVNHRVKMFYGPEYGLTIESVLGSGTQVTLRIQDLSQDSSSPH
ncbi:sensor histidine kinase [Enterococcus casseliflavus]|uniref:sensor histidine kinase n=1 Tax=Enterococcus casseliflavus TaxID=37734 RepID=UPI0018834CB7|nr:histidine kinase [Enterococcus casseliflavus]MBE9907552.1 sensor histidine kinase [Enterococcus casseliflavus]